MVKVDTIEGTIDDVLCYHYDVGRDVLYLRLAAERETPTYAEETDDGCLLFRRESDDRAVGVTVVSWWKRFGSGALPDSLRELAQRIEPWAEKLAA
jgi:hypothetical protein